MISKNEGDRERAFQIKRNIFNQKHHVLSFPEKPREMEETPRDE